MLLQKRNILNSKPNNFFRVSLVSDVHYNSEAVGNPSFPNLPSPPMFFYTAAQKMQKYVDFVNEQKPEIAICLGDCIDGENWEDSFNGFMGYWNNIDGQIPTLIAAGNHDYYNAIPSPRHDYVSGKLGYGASPIIAGSRMNVSFAINHPIVNVRFINFESNMTEAGVFNGVGGFYSTEMINWIKSEILSCNEDIIILTTHKYRNHIDVAEKNKLENALVEVKAIRPTIKPYILFGHSHIPLMYKFNTAIGNFEMFNASALVDNVESEHYVLNIDKTGVRGFDTKLVKYE